MTGENPSPGRSSGSPFRERSDGPTQDELLDEALEETFPASDPVSVYRLLSGRGTD